MGRRTTATSEIRFATVTHTRLALAAFQQRWSTGHARSATDFVADAERLAALARADSTDPATAAAIGQALSIQFGLWYLYAAVVTRSPVRPPRGGGDLGTGTARLSGASHTGWPPVSR